MASATSTSPLSSRCAELLFEMPSLLLHSCIKSDFTIPDTNTANLKHMGFSLRHVELSSIFRVRLRTAQLLPCLLCVENVKAASRIWH